MFEQALKATANLTVNVQNGFLARLDRVRSIGRQLGNGVGEEMDVLLSEFDLSVLARGGAHWKWKLMKKKSTKRCWLCCI
jgi:hypothetical protein